MPKFDPQRIAHRPFPKVIQTEIMPSGECILTIRDVAALLKVSISWVYDRLRDNARDRLPGYKLQGVGRKGH
jgi:hypothetical protein